MVTRHGDVDHNNNELVQQQLNDDVIIHLVVKQHLHTHVIVILHRNNVRILSGMYS